MEKNMTNAQWDKLHAEADKFYAENERDMNGLDEIQKATNFAIHALAAVSASPQPNFKGAVIEILANCAYRYVHPESVHKLDPQSVIDKQIDNGVETLKKFFAPAPAQEPPKMEGFSIEQVVLDNRTGEVGGKVTHEAAQPVENSSRCVCAEVRQWITGGGSGDKFWTCPQHGLQSIESPISGGASTPLYSEQELKDQGLQASTIDYGAEGSATMYSKASRPSGPSAPKVEPRKSIAQTVRDAYNNYFTEYPGWEDEPGAMEELRDTVESLLETITLGLNPEFTELIAKACESIDATPARPTQATETASAPRSKLLDILEEAPARLERMDLAKADDYMRYASAPSVAGTQPTARCPKCGEEMQGGFFRVSVNSTSAIKWRCKGNDESFHEFIINREAQLRPFFSGAAQGTPQVERPEKCECGHKWHGDKPCKWTGEEEGMELHCECPISYVTFDEQYFLEHLLGAPAQPGPEEKR